MPRPFDRIEKFRNLAKRLIEIKATSFAISAHHRMQSGADCVDIRVHRPGFHNVDCERLR